MLILPDVMILCGGQGTRLRSVVGDRQKCVAEVAGRPFLAHLLAYLERQGFRRFILCTGFQAESVLSALQAEAQRLDLVVSPEPCRLGTGGAVRQALPLVRTDTVLVLNGDSFCPADYPALVRWHDAHDYPAAMLLNRPQPERRDCGRVLLDSDSRVTAFREKPDGVDGWINAGAYLFTRAAVGGFPGETPLSLETGVFPQLAALGQLGGQPTTAPLLDIGVPERYRQAAAFVQAFMSGREAP
ncbi:MAG: nucleotidyltransferase family protein [Lentisphaeria bacterium]